MKINSLKSNIEVSKCILLAIISTIYSFRVIYNSSIITYVPIFLFILIQSVYVYRSRKKIKIKKYNKFKFYMMVLFLVNGILIFLAKGGGGGLLKFFLFVWLGNLVGTLAIGEIKKTIKIIVVITSIYSIYVIMYVDLIKAKTSGLNGELNYLNVTWSTAIGLTILLTTLFFKRDIIINKIIIIFISIIHIFALLAFTAIGSVVFPILSVLIIFTIKNINKIKNIYKIFILFFILIIMFNYFYKYLEDYAVMVKILRKIEALQHGETNDRFELWRSYFKAIRNDYILGIGIRNSPTITKNYPHNFLIEILGETGIFGIVLFFNYVIFQIRQFIISYKYYKNDYVFLIIAGLNIYYLLTYFKSFSIFEAFQFFCVIGMFDAYRKNIRRKKCQYQKTIY